MADRGLDQKRLAERMETEPGTVSKLLNGRMRVDLNWLSHFAEALDCEVQDLFHDPQAPTQNQLLRDIPPDQLDRVIRAAKALTGTDD